MKRINLLFVIFVSLFLVACSSDTNEYTLEQRNSLAQCMTDAWAIMYGTERCQHCKNQKSRFWEAFELINFVDCDANRIQCQAAWVKWFPTWVSWSETFAWDMKLEQLAEIYGCQL